MAQKLTTNTFFTNLKRLLSYFSDYKPEIFTLSMLGVLSALGNGSVPFITGKFLDGLITSNELFGQESYIFWLVVWVVAQTIIAFVDWDRQVKIRHLSEDIQRSFTSNSFIKLLHLPMNFHKKEKIGAVTNQIGRTANAMFNFNDGVLLRLTPQFLSIIVALGLAFYLNPLLASVLLVGIAFYIIIAIPTMKPLGHILNELQAAYSKAGGVRHDAVINAQAVKQSTTEDYEARMITNSNNQAKKWWYKITRVWAKLSLYQRLTITATQTTVFVLSIFLINNNTITIGELVAFNAYAAMVFGPFVALAGSWQNVEDAIVSISKVEKLVGTKPEDYHPENAVMLEKLSGGIKFENVVFKYEKGKEILKDVSLEVKPGEVIALVGKSGEGKSTLIDLISGYHFAKKGQVLIDGHNVKKLDLKFLRGQIAVVPQEVVLFNDTIEKNIKYGSFGASRKQVVEAARQAHALEFIEKFPKKWKQVVGERGVKLSVGQKQRVAIARAILRDPKILILDEPTSALDAESEHFITKSLEELMRGRTTFIIAHRLSTVRQADKIIVIEDGQIVEMGKHHELIEKENGAYRRLHELQVGLHE